MSHKTGSFETRRADEDPLRKLLLSRGVAAGALAVFEGKISRRIYANPVMSAVEHEPVQGTDLEPRREER